MLSEVDGLITAANDEPGTVIVTAALSATATEIWWVLTEPALVKLWFGRLTPALRSGGSARLDFGDGDFFTLEIIRLDAPKLVEYAWRFLGTGPLDTITWRIVPQDVGCLVVVTDKEPERSRESALLLREGWLDFARRLAEFVVTGKSSRYDWRREIDGSIELPATKDQTWKRLFAPDLQGQWLPLGASVLETGAGFTLADNVEPSVFQLTDVTREPSSRLQFHLSHPSWLSQTSCTMELLSRRDHAILSISHIGWEDISSDGAYQLHQRKRFCAFWVKVLHCARRLIEQGE